MNLRSFKKLAAVSAVALSAAMYSHTAGAAAVQSGDPTTVTTGATVENTFTVTVVQTLDFGTVGAMMDPTDTATFTVEPDGSDTFTDDPGNGYLGTDPAALVSSEDDPAVAANVTVAGFKNVNIWVTYDNFTDVASGGDAFEIQEVHDNLSTLTCTGAAITTPTNGAATLAAPASPTIGLGCTDASGDMDYLIGGTIETKTGTYGPYPDGAYAGAFDVTFSY